MSIRLLIADDQRLFRQSLRIALERESDLKVIGEAGDGQEAYEQAKALRPEMILMDVEMPKLDGITATRLLVKERADIKILMLSAYADDERVLQAVSPAVPSVNFSELNLTKREQDIVDLLVQGKSNKEMADQLCLSGDTIKAHLQHIFRKVGVSSRLEAVVYLLTGRRAS